MAELTNAQLLFLATQNVPLEKTFDAEGFPTGLYKEVMSADDLWVAYGVKPCKRAGHTLRIRNGTCMQCDTRQLGYLKRWQAAGYIYVAHSAAIAATKVGVATDPARRIGSLNNVGYGGAQDWKIFNSHACVHMGLLEHRVHAKLSPHRASVSYLRDGFFVECRELFNKSPTTTWKIVTKALEGAA